MDDPRATTTVTPEDDARIVEILVERDGTPTKVLLGDGRVYKVLNIAWGYDFGDPYAHVSTNVSPSPEDTTEFPFDFFFTCEVAKVVDPLDNRVLWEGRKAV